MACLQVLSKDEVVRRLRERLQHPEGAQHTYIWKGAGAALRRWREMAAP